MPNAKKNLVNKLVRKISSVRPSDVYVRDPMVAACSRIDTNGSVRPYRKSYLKNRNKMISEMLKEISLKGAWDESAVRTPEFSQCDERVVEYPFVASAIAKFAQNNKIEMADYGCVLNNPVMQDVFDKFVQMTWFLNVSNEMPLTRGNIAHIEADVRYTDMHERMQYPLVTCLSTLEHIGMDNTRYGGTPAEFTSPPVDPEEFAMAGLRNLKNFVQKDGTLIVSVPSGPFEYVKAGRNPQQFIYYAFDKARVLKLASVLDDFDVEIHIFKVVPGVGWMRTTLEDADLVPYAQGISSSGAVAILEAVRH